MKDKKGIIERIKQIFEGSQEETFADVKTADGRILKADEIVVDQPIMEVTADGEIAVEDGTYILEDGRSLVIVAGIINEIIEAGEEVDIEEEMETEEVEKFDVKTKEGKTFKVGELIVGEAIVEINEAGEEVAIEDGDYILEDGKTIKIVEGLISEIMEAEEEMETEEDSMFAEVIAEMKNAIEEFKNMKETFESLKEENKELKLKVAKFAGEDSEEETETEIKFSANTKEEKLKFFSKK